MYGNEFWRAKDLQKLQLPEDKVQRKGDVNVTEGIKSIDGARLFYREAMPLSGNVPTSVTVLLLHGKMFSSKTWLDLGTLHILAAVGFRTVAIDIPGYANTPAAEISDRATFLEHVIQAFDLKFPVIVSPSMSGFFALPHLLKHWKSIAGYVPVAPVGIEVLEKLPTCKNFKIKEKVYPPLQEFLYDPLPDLSHIQTPTMVVFGEKDRSRSSALMNLLPASQCREIPNGSHPAYLDNPDLWHKLLYNFLITIENTYCVHL